MRQTALANAAELDRFLVSHLSHARTLERLRQHKRVVEPDLRVDGRKEAPATVVVTVGRASPNWDAVLVDDKGDELDACEPKPAGQAEAALSMTARDLGSTYVSLRLCQNRAAVTKQSASDRLANLTQHTP